MAVSVRNEQQLPLETMPLRRLLRRLGRLEGYADYQVNLLLTDDKVVRGLNRDYRNLDRTTDVLSFAYGEPEPGEVEPVLGDLAISVPAAARSAKRYGHDLATELEGLVIHGFIHLIGMDHKNSSQRKAWEQKRKDIIDRLGLE